MLSLNFVENKKNTFLFFMKLLVILLGFSTTKEQGGVLTFALPFIVAVIIVAVPFLLKEFMNLDGYLVFLCYMFISIMGLMTLFAAEPLQAAIRFIFYIFAVLIFLSILTSRKYLHFNALDIAMLLQLSGLSISMYFIVNFVFESVNNGLLNVLYERHVGGLMSLPWGASNVIAQILLVSFASFVFTGVHTRYQKFVAFIIFFAVVVTFSRSVLFFMLLMTFLLLSPKKIITTFITIVIFSSVFLIFFAGDMFNYEDFIDFLSRRTNLEEILSGNDRFGLLLTKFDYFVKHPLEPIGFYSSLMVFNSTAHNFWITTLVEQSLVSLVISILIFMFFLNCCFVLGAKFLCAFLILMLALMVEDPQFTQQYTIVIWIFFACVYVAYENFIESSKVNL